MTAGGFFARFSQEPVSIRGVPGKSPMFFRDFHLMGAVFTADLARVREALPRPGYRPLAVPWRRGLVAVHCMEYKQSDIGPYNEVSLSIALKRGWLPFLSLVEAGRSLQTGVYHAYVKALPVTTEVALHGGVDFFNYPKYLADISFRETKFHRVCTVRDRDSGDVILEFEGKRLNAPVVPADVSDTMTLQTYPELDGRPHRATLLINRLQYDVRLFRGAGLRLGTHPRSEAFSGLGLGGVVEYLYAPRCQGVLFKPEAL